MAIDYQYNGAGQRVLKSDHNAQPVSYFYGPGGELLQSKQSFVLTVISTSHLYLGQTPVGVLTGMGAPMPVETDHLGTPRAVIDPARNTAIWRWELVTGDASQGGSNAFGDRPANEDPDGDESIFRYDLRFPGQQYDAETGLHYNYYRDYEPQTGRYVESDPIGLRGGPSTYSYASQSSLRYIDRRGLAALDCSINRSAHGQIHCDGNGNFRIVNCNKGCTRPCTQQHEEKHVEDWKARYGADACKGIEPGKSPDGPASSPTFGGPLDYDMFFNKSECDAYQKGMDCAKRMRDSTCLSPECEDDVERFLRGGASHRAYRRCKQFGYGGD